MLTVVLVDLKLQLLQWDGHAAADCGPCYILLNFESQVNLISKVEQHTLGRHIFLSPLGVKWLFLHISCIHETVQRHNYAQLNILKQWFSELVSLFMH